MILTEEGLVTRGRVLVHEVRVPVGGPEEGDQACILNLLEERFQVLLDQVGLRRSEGRFGERVGVDA